MQENKVQLLDLPPEDFSIYMKELEQSGYDKEHLSFIRGEYQKRQGALKDPFSSSNQELESQGRERASFLPVSKPKDKSVWDAFLSGETEWATPGAIAGGVEEAVGAINAPANMLKGVPYTKEEVEQKGIASAGMTMGASGLTTAPAGALRTFGGLNAQAKNTSTFRKARDLEDMGADPKKVFKETGWFRDPVDRKWRFEIDDSKAVYHPVTSPEALDKTVPLKDVFEHEDLYKNYPGIADTPVTHKTYYNPKTGEVDKDLLGEFNPKTGEIFINSQLDADTAKRTLLHELQHGIQMREGFTAGSNEAKAMGHPQIQALRASGADEDSVKRATFKFYEGNGGEIEARLVEDRMDLEPEIRRAYYPNVHRESLYEPGTQNAHGEVGLKPKVSDFIIDRPEDMTSVLENVPLVKQILNAPTGKKLKSGYTYEGVVFTPPKALPNRMPRRDPEFRNTKGEILSLYYTSPEGKIVLKPLSDFLEEKGVGKNYDDWR